MMMRPMAIGMFVVPVWNRLDESGSRWNEVPNRDTNRHREQDPQRQVAIEKRELLAGRRSANLPLGKRSGGHQQASQDDSWIVVGRGAPSSDAYLEGEQQAFERRARSACIASIFLEPAQGLLQDLRGTDVWWHDDPVMHPLSLASRRDDARAAKVCKVSGNLRLRDRRGSRRSSRHRSLDRPSDSGGGVVCCRRGLGRISRH